MPWKPKGKTKWIIGLVALAVVAFIGFRYWKGKKSALPEGIVSGNGRIEAKLADVAAKEPLRVREILVNEGDLVRPGQVVVRLDTTTLESSLAEANANVAATQEKLAVAQAGIVRQKSEIQLATIEVDRARRLVARGAGSQRDLDVRESELKTTRASLAEAEATLKTSQEEIEVARASAATIQTRINDATLRSPVTGRVLYRLAEPGEVLAPGGPALTILNLEDVYMEIFLPANEASRIRIGAEARLTADFEPDRSVPGYVSFVSPEAQFTPKQVETKSEREKLVFRVKLQVPRELAGRYVERIKTGIRGVGYVKVDPNAAWPSRLQNVITAEAEPH
ncbi:HlyD family efflux transporter periplasmic adaptor subunit [Corallococcus sp. AB049A]|uniref:HlyD family efflux transporter periplasmic adaptor subunit n=1 Tax=Corallococcus interemptor TaxID=2316720 RepID=A0A3A8QVI9_9BACT|nr:MULTISPECIES: HlyD family efflux transporter periplasmic adaptor subunit [Corallococcus]RKH52139.1 HlyD family efflux transporter periplasmic adaptor subunit [Corallococcus sp. AB050B]RKH72597.1 HlyD family efflux transporter periplasmic adaptor subunit [Corallococcus interemptor]RKI65995.1 HlyD family efflux transporter periplasmic adaptor subunit [Corallococcus sp. AB049A]